ncbi:MAG: amino acid--tRNA ligase-related protein [Patescibacteria group bacterium]
MDWQTLKNNPDTWQIFSTRAEIISKVRQFFNKQGFLEVQTPLLAPALIPESYLEVFETKLINKNGKSQRAFLAPSPELWHKKLLAAGADKIFEITKSFRNTDLGGSLHNPEFTMLEWYRTEANYQSTIEDCQKLIKFLKPEISEFEKITVTQAFEKYAQIDDIFKLSDDDFNLIYVRDVEPKLGFERPTIIYNYPQQFAPLAKTSSKDQKIKERFELYINGIELADGYTELTDPEEQGRQFKKEVSVRKQNQKIQHPTDKDFLKALRSGIPNCSGVAVGLDRLIMILTNQSKIDDVILFSGSDLFPKLA